MVKLVKVSLILFNFVFMVFGLAALGLGIYVQMDLDLHEILSRINAVYEVKDMEQFLKAGAIVLSVVGGIIFFVSIVGCCGAAKESPTLLCIYILFLVIIMGLEVAAVALSVILKDQITDNLKKIIKDKLRKSYLGYAGSKDGTDIFTTAVDMMQLKGHCCGIIDHRDFYNVTAWNRTMLWGKRVLIINKKPVPGALPWSCCKPLKEEETDISNFEPADIKGCQIDQKQEFTYIFRGCFDRIMLKIKEHAVALIAIGATIFVIQFAGMIFSCCLMSSKRKSSKQKRRYNDSDVSSD